MFCLSRDIAENSSLPNDKDKMESSRWRQVSSSIAVDKSSSISHASRGLAREIAILRRSSYFKFRGGVLISSLAKIETTALLVFLLCSGTPVIALYLCCDGGSRRRRR